MPFDRLGIGKLPGVMQRYRRLLLSLLVLALLCWALLYLLYFPEQHVKRQPSFMSRGNLDMNSGTIVPVPLEIKLDPAKSLLGKRLFHDPRLSGDGTVSCASCHGLDHGGADHMPHSRGVGGQEGAINTPTVFNSGFNFRQFWDGRAKSLEDQIDGPVQNPVEMASSWPQVLRKLRADADYPKAFAGIYPDGITANNVKNAIATFERSLYTPNSRFDRFLRGDKTALNADELAGYRMFEAIGCVSCHQGVNVGGNLYEKMGVIEDYFAARGGVTKADMGRYNRTGIDEQRFEFKVPSLRNVALTAPYFHDGSANTLETAVYLMAKHQLGLNLGEAEQRQIAGFLRTLTGEYQGELLR